MIVWVAKDRVSIVAQNPFQSEMMEPDQQQSEMPQQKTDGNTDGDTSPTANSAIDALKRCKNYKEVNRVTRQFGSVRGEINSTEGFDHPEQCIIAVFSADYALVALLDKGGSSRVDLLTGQVISNPELYYDKEKGYKLWYFQQ